MTYRIRVLYGSWRLLRHGAIIGTYRTKAEAREAELIERERRGE